MDTYDKAAAYKAVMDRIRQTQDLKPPHGPTSWLAEKLSLSRQNIHYWEERGIPEKYADTIANLLEMDPIEVCPSLIYLPEAVFKSVLAKTTRKKPFHIKLADLIRAGLRKE